MSIKQDSSKKISEHSDEEEGNSEEGENESRVRSNLKEKNKRHEFVVNLIGKICILMLFIIFLILAVDVFSLLSKKHHNLEPDKQQNNFQLVRKEETQNQQIQTNLVKSPINTQEIINQIEEEQQIEQTLTQDKSEIPRILWLQTDDQLQVKGMQEAIFAQNLIHFAKLSNYQVRIVNNLNAYDWLSQKSIAQIKETYQKSKVDVPVEEMLRLALLAQHGGISIRLPNILLLQTINWIQKIFQLNNLSYTEKKGLSCTQAKPTTQILVLHTINPEGYIKYEDDLIAARPNSRLIKVIQLVFNKVIKEGTWPYPNFQIAVFNQMTRIKSFPDMTKHLINIFSRQDSNLCRNYGLQSIHIKEGPYASMISDDQASNTVKMDLKKFKQKYGQPKILRINMQKIAHDIVDIIKTGDMSFGNGNSLLKKKLMMIEGNKWLTIPKSQKRDVNFCIVSLKPQQNEQIIHKQLKQLSKQSFTNWNHVSFLNNLHVVFKKVTDKSFAVNASIYQGLNLQRAATKYCDPKSVILLLDNDEQLSSQQDLSKLAKNFQRISTFAAFVHLKKDNQVYQTSSASRKSIVKQKIQRTVNQPNHQLIKDISNFLRVFTVQIYRFISPNQLLHSSTGRYFDREIPLIAMLQLSEHFSACREVKIAYQVRKVQQLMAIPEHKIFSNTIISITQFRQPDFTLFEYFAKFRHHELCNTIQFCKRNHLSVQKLVSFNNGRQNLHLSAKNSSTEKVPRKIHQIWITGQMPKFKQQLSKRLRDAHPDYEYTLWSENNFTRDNFPQSYDLLKNLLQYDRKIPTIKTSMIADIMRYQIVYMQGGFFVDTNFMFFGDRPLDKFLPYSMVMTGELSPAQKVYKDHSFFSCAQKCPQLARIVSHQSLSGRRKYSINNDKETGRVYFAKITIDNQENIFQPSFEEFYPNLIYDFPVINRNKCIPNAVIDNEQILFNSTRRSYMKNCSKIYSYAYGINFMEEGFTFGASRW